MHWLRWLFLTSPHSIPARDAPAPWTWWDDDANLNKSPLLNGELDHITNKAKDATNSLSHLRSFRGPPLTCLLNT